MPYLSLFKSLMKTVSPSGYDLLNSMYEASKELFVDYTDKGRKRYNGAKHMVTSALPEPVNKVLITYGASAKRMIKVASCAIAEDSVIAEGLITLGFGFLALKYLQHNGYESIDIVLGVTNIFLMKAVLPIGCNLLNSNYEASKEFFADRADKVRNQYNGVKHMVTSALSGPVDKFLIAYGAIAGADITIKVISYAIAKDSIIVEGLITAGFGFLALKYLQHNGYENIDIVLGVTDIFLAPSTVIAPSKVISDDMARKALQLQQKKESEDRSRACMIHHFITYPRKSIDLISKGVQLMNRYLEPNEFFELPKKVVQVLKVGKVKDVSMLAMNVLKGVVANGCSWSCFKLGLETMSCIASHAYPYYSIQCQYNESLKIIENYSEESKSKVRNFLYGALGVATVLTCIVSFNISSLVLNFATTLLFPTALVNISLLSVALLGGVAYYGLVDKRPVDQKIASYSLFALSCVSASLMAYLGASISSLLVCLLTTAVAAVAAATAAVVVKYDDIFMAKCYQFADTIHLIKKQELEQILVFEK